MFKNSSKRLIALLLAAIMIIGIMPVTVFATGTAGSVTNYDDFMSNLKVLEQYADEYAKAVGRNAGELVLNFIRTGVERYQDDNWTTLAGHEIIGFTNYVEQQDVENGSTAMKLKNIVIDDFVLPNENPADFGHMFGCMNISYINKGSADLSGWAGDICDLLQYSVSQLDAINANTDGSIESMAAYIGEYCFGVNASGAYGWDDFYGDMDAFYLVSEYNKAGGSVNFSDLMEAYFKEDLDDIDRAVYFMNNRFAVADNKEAVRKAIYESYSADVGLKILESKRGLTSYNALREACCYAFADYLYSVAGGQGLFIPGSGGSDGPENGYYTVFSNEHSILAPGIEQDINYAQTADGKQIVYYVATVDVTRDDVTIVANYKDNDPSKGWGLQSVRDQVYALIENNKDKENYYPIVATNGDGYNITNGTPGGLLIMNGTEYYPVDRDGFFAILKDGTAVIGTQAEYENYRGQIQDAIGGFGAVLVKDGKINVTKSSNYTSNRASRTAIGIKADGSVVMMVLDGRQLPRSAGGAMEEIAQIMLEAGCVHAINLDGGGSTTYLSKPAGSDEIQLTNVPSDGYERQVSVSLVAISTAAPSTAFDHAIVTSDYDYITAGTTMQFSVTGVSNTGNAADIPDGSYWRVSDETIASIDANGKFTALANGEVTVEYIVDGKVGGSKKIGVVIPDDIKFVEDRITAIYGVPKEIEVTVWYKDYPVAFTPLKDAFVFFDYEFDAYGNPLLYFTSDAGYINGLEFVGNDAKGIRTTNVLAALMIGKNIIARMSTINLYYTDEATFDFENATQGNRKLAWNREIENAKSTDNQLYRISDPDSPVEIDYTFALDITAIDFPPQLEPIKSMLPTYQDGASAWNYLLQLAERVCTQTKVTIRAEFSPELNVDVSELKVINDYFTLTSYNLDENNVLTIVCNWVNQSQPIDPATANPLCILSGIKATVKDTAAYYNNEVLIANNGYVSYDIYLAASSLYSFAQDINNQAQFGLYPYIHEEDCRSDFVTDDPNADASESTDTNNDKGARFSSQYMDFADIYVINNEIRQGWHEEGSDYYYYVDNEALTGTQLVPDRHDATKDRFYEFDSNGKLVSEDGTTGLVTFNGDLYYAVLGEAQKGWQVYDGNNYYFDPDTGKAVDGKFTIRENKNSWQTGDFEYTFEDHILVKGVWEYDTYQGKSGWRYRWAGDWMKACWFEVDGKIYNVVKNYPYYVITGYGHYIKDYRDGQETTGCYLFDEKGALMVNFTGAAYIESRNEYRYFVEGVLYSTIGIAQGNDGYYYHVNGDGTVSTSTTVKVNEAQGHGYVPAGDYEVDEFGRLTKKLVEVETKIDNISTSVIGRVVTVAKDAPVCRIGYFKNDVYVALDATKNADGSYNFVAPKDVDDVVIVLSGDADGDGAVNETDIADMKETVLSGDLSLGSPDDLAADVNGDGRVTAADIARLNAALKGKTDIEW